MQFLKRISNQIFYSLNCFNLFLLASPILLCCLLLSLDVLKDPGQFANPQFWAEDGTIFFAQAFNFGMHSFFFTYAGYFHEIERVVAYFTVKFIPYKFAPLTFLYSAVLCMFLTVSRCLSSRINIPFKSFLVLLIFLIPTYGEVYNGLLAVNWILAPILIFYIFYQKPSSGKVMIFDLILIFLVSLTGPFSLMVVPLYIWRWLDQRDRYSLLLLYAVMIPAFCQLGALWMTHNVQFGDSNSGFWGNIGGRFFEDIFYYHIYHHSLNPIFSTFMALFLPFIVTFILIDNSEYKYFKYVLLYFWLANMLSLQVRAGIESLIAHVAPGDRYDFIPILMLAWLIVLGLNSNGLIKKWVCLLLLVLMIFNGLVGGHYRDQAKYFVDLNWASWAIKIGKGPVEIPINPLHIPPATVWAVHLK